MRPQRLEEGIEHVDVAIGSRRLGRSFDSKDAAFTNGDAPHFEIHVGPLECDHLVGPHPCQERGREIRPVMRMDALQENLHFPEGEGIDERLYFLETADVLGRWLIDLSAPTRVVEKTLQRNHDVVLPLRGDVREVAEELFHVDPRHPA